MPTMTTDRDGHPWKAYPSGRILCAATTPLHDALLDDGTCDCLIASYTWPLRRRS